MLIFLTAPRYSPTSEMNSYYVGCSVIFLCPGLNQVTLWKSWEVTLSIKCERVSCSQGKMSIERQARRYFCLTGSSFVCVCYKYSQSVTPCLTQTRSPIPFVLFVFSGVWLQLLPLISALLSFPSVLWIPNPCFPPHAVILCCFPVPF